MALWGQVPVAKPDPWDLPDRRREATPTGCPLTSTLTSGYKHTHTYTCTHKTNVIKKI